MYLRARAYLIPIIITSLGIVYDLYPSFFPTYNTFIFIAIDALIAFAWKHALALSKIEILLKREKFFIDRRKLPPLSERIEKAKKSIWIMSQTFTILIGTYFGLLETKCNEGCEIRILLFNPKKITSKMRSNLSQDVLRDQLNSSIKRLREYKERSEKGKFINARLLPFEAGFGLFIIDGDEPEGQIKVELMLTNTDPNEWANVIITKKEGKRYHQLIKHYNGLWELSDPI